MSQLPTSASVLLFILSLYGATISLSRAKLPELPNQMKVCSTVLYSNGTSLEQYRVQEYVNQQEGSIRVDVLNVSGGRREDASDKLVYFKLMSGDQDTPGTGTSDQNEAESLVLFDIPEGRCKESSTSEWQLKDLTKLVSRLVNNNEVTFKGIRSKHSPLSIGPFGLLKLVYDNADMFTLDSHSYDELTYTDNYHFSMRLYTFWQQRTTGRLVATMSVGRDSSSQQRDSLKDGQSLSSQDLTGTAHLSSIAIVVARNSPTTQETVTSLSLLEEMLYNGQAGLVSGSIVEYNLINECLMRKRLEHRELDDDVKDPFLMPSGSGCGKLMNNNRPYYVEATQFSGQFEAKDFKGEFYAAYDQASSHLRYDQVGDHKMVYALNSRLVTYVASDIVMGNNKHQPQPQKQEQEQDVSEATGPKKEPVAARNPLMSHAHCAQAEVKGERILWWVDQNWSPWSNVASMVNILGLGPGAGLMYLGKTTLPASYGGRSIDPLNYHVFEREIELADLPVLLYMHIRVKPSDRNRFFLIYYFVDELETLTRANLHGAEPGSGKSSAPPMWLKRVELVSLSEMSKYSFVNAQITFNKFSWSLETVGEDTYNRQLQLAHPVRTFDLAECWPDSGQYQLDVVLQQAGPQQPEQQADSNGLESAEDFLEDRLINDLAREISLFRSQISDFSLQDFTQQRSVAPEQAASSTAVSAVPSLLIQSKLTFPLVFNYKTELLGWVETIEPLQKQNQVHLVKTRLFTLAHECSLMLATEFAQEYSFNMLFCPNEGCGKLLVSLAELEKTSGPNPDYPQSSPNNVKLLKKGNKQPGPGPSISIYYHMCELHMVRKQTHLPGMINKAERVQAIKEDLARADKRIGAFQVTKVALESGSSHLAAAGRDQVVVAGDCYTEKTRLLKDLEPLDKVLGDNELRLVALRPHSRVHCHKACLLYHYCETYSYNRTSGECILANIQADTLKDEHMTLEHAAGSDDNCAIYSIDQIAAYRRTSEIVPQTPANFVSNAHKTKGVVLAGVELSKCASLCHSIDWSMRTGSQAGPDGDALTSLALVDDGCQRFSYMHLKSLCKFIVPDRAQFVGLFRAYDLRADRRRHQADPDSSLTLIGNVDELEEYLGGDNKRAHEVEAMDTYKRDMGQFYSMLPSAYLDLVQPSTPADDATGAGATAGAVGVTPTLIRERYFFDDCLRECTLGHCYAFDFCSEYSVRMHVGTCYLYSIRSPLSIDALRAIRLEPGYLDKWPKLKINPQQTSTKTPTTVKIGARLEHYNRNQLTKLEELFYYVGKSDGHEVLVKNRDRCEHHYLAGDYLQIKRSLIEASGSVGAGQLNSPSRHHNAGSDPAEAQPASAASFSALSLAIQLAAGLIIGVVMFIIKPTVTNTIAGKLKMCKSSSPEGEPSSLDKLRSTLSSRAQKRQHSQSTLEIHEMVDIE